MGQLLKAPPMEQVLKAPSMEQVLKAPSEGQVPYSFCFHDEDGHSGNDDSNADANVNASRLPPRLR